MSITLHLGDMLSVMASLPDKSVDAIITDLPYGTTACKWDAIIPFEPMWEQVKRVCKGAFVTTASQPFTSLLVMSNISDFKYEAIFYKGRGTSAGVAKYRLLPSHEDVLIFGKEAKTYNPQMEVGAPYKSSKKKMESVNGNEHKYGYKNIHCNDNSGTRFPHSVIRINTHGIPGQHPTQKPVALYEYLIRTYTNEGDTVGDFTFGSGTTAVACVNTNRNFIGSELDAGYYAIAERRIHDAQEHVILPFGGTL